MTPMRTAPSRITMYGPTVFLLTRRTFGTPLQIVLQIGTTSRRTATDSLSSTRMATTMQIAKGAGRVLSMLPAQHILGAVSSLPRSTEQSNSTMMAGRLYILGESTRSSSAHSLSLQYLQNSAPSINSTVRDRQRSILRNLLSPLLRHNHDSDIGNVKRARKDAFFCFFEKLFYICVKKNFGV